MSSSESEVEEFVSIIATRQRRSNAGSRMRKLLEMEELNEEIPAVVDEDDENVNLLFQEDGEDDEFKGSDEESNEEQESEESGEENQLNEENRGHKRSRSIEDDNKDNAGAADSDVNLSDSDISASDSDESEGERELKQQEKTAQRKKRKHASHEVKKPPPKPKLKPKVKPSHNINDLPIDRRQSSRKATLDASIALQEKLKEEEEKKQTVKPVPKKEHIEITLEERLEEAKLTEAENTLSLSLFFEHEDERKKRQRELANARKFKLKEFVRMYSSGIYISPLNEVEYLEERQRLIDIEEEKRIKRKQQYQKRKQLKLIKEAKERGLPIPEFKDDDEGVTIEEEEEEPAAPPPPAEEGPHKQIITPNDPKIEEKQEGEVEIENETDPLNTTQQLNHVEDTEQQDIEEGRVFEGPSQLAAYQYVSFEEFRKPIDMDFIKKTLFGPQSLLLSHRDPAFETLEVIRADNSSTIDLKKINDARSSQFEGLLKLPRFGEKYTEVRSFDDDGDRDDFTVRIRTPLPTGISLANGQRKKCLISGTIATYYDPNNGLPYSNVECFKILKDITENKFSWCQIDNGGVNSRYKFGVGCYLKDIGQRHAKGVPKGFE